MGYCMSQHESAIHIDEKNVRKALKAVKDLSGKETITDGSGRHFSWVDHNFAKANDFKSVMKAWRWEVVFDDDGNVSDLRFYGEKLGDDFILLNAIAPFVKNGGYIEMHGEDGTMWRWLFNGKTCTEKEAKVVWED